MAEFMISMSYDEVRRSIAYPLICETMCGSSWETGRRRRAWAAQFSEAERKACSSLKRQAMKWHLRTGVPENVVMSEKTFNLWKKLEAFCASML